MGIFSSINIAATGMSAERLRTDVISDNIANASTTSSQEGGYFRRSRVVLAQKNDGIDWRLPFVSSDMDRGVGTGVRVTGIEKDNSEPRLSYEPDHPHAILSGPKAGYVEYPNVNMVRVQKKCFNVRSKSDASRFDYTRKSLKRSAYDYYQYGNLV